MMASSSNILSYHLTRLSINLNKRGLDIIVLSGPKEQVVGLSNELARTGIRHTNIRHIDGVTIQDILKTAKEIRKILKRNDVDVIHAHGVAHTVEAYLAVNLLCSDRRPSIVTSMHSVPENGPLGKLKLMCATTMLNVGSDAILPVSDNTRELLIQHGLDPQKTAVLHNAIDLEVFDEAVQKTELGFKKEKNHKPAIVCVADLTWIKGQEYYLMAAAEVLKCHSAVFYVVGSGPRRNYLEELVHRLRIDKEVVFTGRIQWPEIYPFLSNIADVCVSSSISENFPFYILECMAAHKPIVATNVGGVSEAVLDGVNGYLVPSRDPDSLADAILRLISDRSKAREMGLEGRRLVERRFSMDVITNGLQDAYEMALTRRPPSVD